MIINPLRTGEIVIAVIGQIAERRRIRARTHLDLQPVSNEAILAKCLDRAGETLLAILMPDMEKCVIRPMIHQRPERTTEATIAAMERGDAIDIPRGLIFHAINLKPPAPDPVRNAARNGPEMRPAIFLIVGKTLQPENKGVIHALQIYFTGDTAPGQKGGGKLTITDGDLLDRLPGDGCSEFGYAHLSLSLQRGLIHGRRLDGASGVRPRM